MASRTLNRIRDFNHSPSHSRRGQERDRNDDQHGERIMREHQRTDHVERHSNEESSGKQKRSKTKARTTLLQRWPGHVRHQKRL